MSTPLLSDRVSVVRLVIKLRNIGLCSKTAAQYSSAMLACLVSGAMHSTTPRSPGTSEGCSAQPANVGGKGGQCLALAAAAANHRHQLFNRSQRLALAPGELREYRALVIAELLTHGRNQ
jgi:hypothetical protein